MNQQGLLTMSGLVEIFLDASEFWGFKELLSSVYLRIKIRFLFVFLHDIASSIVTVK